MLVFYAFFAAQLRARGGDDERGAALVEYALLVALIAIVCIAGVTFVGKTARSRFQEMGTAVTNDV